MARVELFPHQKRLLDVSAGNKNTLFTVGLGLGKTDTSLSKAEALNGLTYPVLILCQKSKINDWKAAASGYNIRFLVMSIDTAWRREKELLKTFQPNSFILIIDESQQIKNTTASRSKFVLKLQPKNTILLSGTPFQKWEDSITHLHLLGCPITKKDFYKRYCNTVLESYGGGRPFIKIVGYKNIPELQR